MKDNHVAPEGKSRRGLLMGALYGIPLLIGGTLITSIGNYLLGKQAAQTNSWADAGDISEMPAGEPRQVRFERAVVDGWKVENEHSSAWVIVDEQRNVTAFSSACTHLGCAYRWEAKDNLFTCACHGSEFNLRGEVVKGPASRPLDRYPTKVEDRRLWLGPLEDSQGA